jgi:hypothetical protein
MRPSGAAGDARENWGKHNGKDVREIAEVAFFRGASLRPIPPGESKQKEVRYLDIYEDGELDEAQLAAWVKQASQLSGKQM